MGKLLYDRAADTDASEETIREFMEVCPSGAVRQDGGSPNRHTP
jgi:hypothetical protein